MAAYAEILLFAIPGFVLLILLEKLYGVFVSKDYTPWPDAISSMSSGITNILKDVLGIGVVLIGYSWLVNHVAIVEIPSNFLVVLIAFVCIDFSYYWIHRWQHTINILWNEHIIHHSSEEFNLACALRQTISVILKWQILVFIPAAILGVPEVTMAIVVPIHLFMQFWYHTRHIDKMGILEYILVTPSHHRVHHALNKEYMDKNFSAIFIVWDKLFGTFQEELVEVKPVYGVSRPVKTWNPFKINFMHLWVLLKDAFYSNSLRDTLIIWFKPTGWRPKRSELMYDIEKVDSPTTYVKYSTDLSNVMVLWAGLQLLFNLGITIVLFLNIQNLSYGEMLALGSLVFLGIYCYTDLMDRNKLNWVFEVVRLLFCVSYFYFGLFSFLEDFILFFILGWMVVSIVISMISSLKHREDFVGAS